MDGRAAARDVPPVLRPRGDAHLLRQHGGAVQVEQEGVRHGAGQLLLGLLLHPSLRRLRQRPRWRGEDPRAVGGGLGVDDRLHPDPGPLLLPAHLLHDAVPVPHGPVARRTRINFMQRSGDSGVHYPSLASLCSQKVVESDRGFLMSTVASGSYLGTLVIGGAGSLMLDLYGWESVFYVSGLLSVLWAYCMWKYLLKGEGPIITLESLGSGGSHSKLSKRHWLRLLRQPAVCAVIITHLCTASTFFTLLSWLPTFFKDTFPDAKGWVFNVVPWLVAIPSSLFSGFLSDHLIAQGYDTASVRKMMQFFSMGVSSVFTLLLCGNTTFAWAVAFVSATMGFTTFSHSGVSVNVQDLAPSCAGALFGVMNTCGAFSGVLMVYFSGYLIETTGSWTSVFALITTVNLLGLCTFLAFAEARRVDIDPSKARYANIHI
uniref:Solute carrier family 17 member 9 n=1 Tax=Gasterosteus aculeatus aculeatus TaxID=481459 RepID=G3NDP6_GASAC